MAKVLLHFSSGFDFVAIVLMVNAMSEGWEGEGM